MSLAPRKKDVVSHANILIEAGSASPSARRDRLVLFAAVGSAVRAATRSASKAMFPAANGIAVGTDVRGAGLRVRSVAAQKLEPNPFRLRDAGAGSVGPRSPSDSSAAITSESLLGGSFVALIPGGSQTPLKEGDTDLETQGLGRHDEPGRLRSSIVPNSEAPAPTSQGMGTMEETPKQ
jgi:phospholipid/cholesterol/gamma-HCH transport system substrate-binding protein